MPKRRADHEGSAYERGDGTWVAACGATHDRASGPPSAQWAAAIDSSGVYGSS